MRVAIDSDTNGTELKKVLIEYFRAQDFEIEDLDFLGSGQELDYPDVAFNLAGRIRDREYDRGILICGTGLGMAMCANKVKGVFAGACSDIYAAQRLVRSNDAQVLALGALVTGKESAKCIAEAFLTSSFQGGGSLSKVNRMRDLENSQNNK